MEKRGWLQMKIIQFSPEVTISTHQNMWAAVIILCEQNSISNFTSIHPAEGPMKATEVAGRPAASNKGLYKRSRPSGPAGCAGGPGQGRSVNSCTDIRI
jgi:hypothetical protein